MQHIDPERAKRMLFTGDRINGKQAAEMEFVLQSTPADKLDKAVEELAGRMQIQRISTLFDGISRHSPEGMAFKARMEQVGWKQAIQERDNGSYDWTIDKPIK